MNLNRRILLLAILVASFPWPTASAVGADSGPHTRVRLVADVDAVRPGTTFVVGVLMSMDKGWHTYWKNAGEAGLPTEISWSLPDGFTAGDIQWPIPHKFIEAGDVMTFGYRDETMLLVPITAPANLSQGSRVNLKADVSWLECERICVPGNASAKLSIPISAGVPASANVALFKKYRGQLPKDPAAVVGLNVNIVLVGAAVEIRASRAGEAGTSTDGWDYYPEPVGGITFDRTAVTVRGEMATLTVKPSSSGALEGARTIRGILIVPDPAGNIGVTVEIPLPQEFISMLSGDGKRESSKGVLDREFSSLQAARESRPLALYVLFAVIGGLLLNIMPCVLPVIALKIFGLVKMAGNEPRRTRRLGWMFSLGILASFELLALVVILLQAAGQQVGWGFQFQEPLFVIIMSAVVFAFGLSLFGVYEIRLPGAAVTGVSGLAAKTEGRGREYSASFLEGVFATILATPCTAPFLGSALGFAFSQPPLVIVFIFASVAFGMALPYLLITARPAWLKFLPKPGEWMVTAKQFMGFLMMVTVLWLLYILGKQLGMEAVIWTGAFLLAVGLGCWLVGRFATLSATRGTALVVWVAALVITVLGYMIFLESILEVRALVRGDAAMAQTGAPSEGITWKPFTMSLLEEELNAGRPVFVDFTAEWCLTCKVNERTVLADKEVVTSFSSSGIVAIKADWTNRNPDITRLLQKFGRSGVPLYVLFPAGKPDAPIVLPEVITSRMVVEAIATAVKGGAGG